jgi:hypothetical protein
VLHPLRRQRRCRKAHHAGGRLSVARRRLGGRQHQRRRPASTCDIVREFMTMQEYLRPIVDAVHLALLRDRTLLKCAHESQ